MSEVKEIVSENRQHDSLDNTSFKLIANVYSDINKNSTKNTTTNIATITAP